MSSKERTYIESQLVGDLLQRHPQATQEQQQALREYLQSDEVQTYLAWQDAANELHGDPDDCDCCLAALGRHRHCDHCHPDVAVIKTSKEAR